MVYIHERVYSDLDLIFTGMLQWEKLELSFDFIESYIDDILVQCYDIAKENYRFSTQYPEHTYYGKYIHRYRRNKNTLWYIIYDEDVDGDVFVNKIISNYTTLL